MKDFQKKKKKKSPPPPPHRLRRNNIFLFCLTQVQDYHYGAGSALQLAARGGGTSNDFLTEHGNIEHRLAAVSSRK